METNKEIVQDAEALFLGGNFSKSLMLTNQVLKQAVSNHDNNFQENLHRKMVNQKQISKDHVILWLSTPLQLNFDASQTQRKLAVVLPSFCSNSDDHQKASLVDRAAAVALQSWYEIARRSCQKQQKEHPGMSSSSTATSQSLERGFLHFKPFLEAYAPPAHALASNMQQTQQGYGGRPMSLDLAVVLLQFLRATGGHIPESVEFSAEILYRIWHDPKAQAVVAANPNALDCCQEISVFLFTELLPFLAEPKDVELVVQRCLCRDKKWTAASSRLKTTDRMNPRAIRTILSLLDTDRILEQGACLSEECISICQRDLRRLLELAEIQQNDGSPAGCGERKAFSHVYSEAEAAVFHRELLRAEPTHSTVSTGPTRQAWSSVPTLATLVCRVRLLIENKDLLLKTVRSNPSTLALLILMMVVAWKRRNRLLSVSGTAIQLLLAPLKEILEAVSKPV